MLKLVKSIIVKLLPKKIVEKISNIRQIKLYFRYDRIRYVKFSAIIKKNDTFEKLLGRISQECHVVEKGLTMPEMRPGFGTNTIMNLIDLCNNYLEKNYNTDNEIFLHAIGVLNEYKKIHEELNYNGNKLLLNKISQFKEKLGFFPEVKQIEFSSKAYFRDVNSAFDKFSVSRHSVRNFKGPAEISSIYNAVKLALSAPSSCNRQPWRVYIIEDKRILEEVLSLQNGNRGFGHLINDLILVTSELGVYNGIYERNSVYIDGGIFTMNLVYSLHFYKVGVCILNCYFCIETEKQIRSLINIPESEVLIVLLACGSVPEKFKVTVSKRGPINYIMKNF